MVTNEKCPVCKKGNAVLIESRSNVPVIQNITLSNVEEALDFPQGKLNMCRCNECGFVWNDKFNEKKIHYDDGYNNDVSQSKYYIQHLERMADLVVSSVPETEPIHYVEVGCGNADFLVLVAERSKGRLLSATGFDPSFARVEGIPSVATVHKCVFSETSYDLIPPEVNVICSRHTIEHIQDVHKFARTLSSLTKYADCKLFLETPNVDWILQNVAFQDFFYEHCSLFTPDSLQFLFMRYGIRSEVSAVYNEQYMWSEGYFDRNVLPEYRSKPCSTNLNLSEHYIEQKFELMEYWSNFYK